MASARTTRDATPPTRRLQATWMETALGTLTLYASPRGLVRVAFEPPPPDAVAAATLAHLGAARDRLARYLRGEHPAFDVPLDLGGTPFQRAVWSALCEIPHGETTTYAALAQRIGRPRAVRAVGSANARNPIAILVPCHRVVGSDGDLRGYAGEPWRKRALLELERRGVRGLAEVRRQPAISG